MTSATPGPGPEGRSTAVHTEVVDPYATMGQFSFAPATKTTVVTTTYTTTTTFPPICVNAPGSLAERDPKEYPLAHVQAPESIRKIYFEAGGDTACFEEADVASNKVQEVCYCIAKDMPVTSATPVGTSPFRSFVTNRLLCSTIISRTLCGLPTGL